MPARDVSHLHQMTMDGREEPVVELKPRAFRAKALEAIRALAREGAPFTAEDVASLVGRPPTPNAMGAALLAASRAGTIRKVGYANARRRPRHRSALAVWEGVE